ncbi:unnamed protein product [Lupinus luteus]|uniref:DUF4283 domain-containing protein n=1 Tax=Lupinus luteus TaxID=3873 RepID=A0AAV1XNF0_LUPLU
MEALLRDERAWFENKLVAICKWKPTDAAKDRFFWIRCFGVPLQAWEENFFEKLLCYSEASWAFNISPDLKRTWTMVVFSLLLHLGPWYSWFDQIYEENAGKWASEEEDSDVAVGNQLPPSQATQVPNPNLMVQIGPDDLPVPAHPQSPQLASVLASQLSALNVGFNADSFSNHSLISVEPFAPKISPLEPLELNGKLTLDSSLIDSLDNGPLATDCFDSEFMNSNNASFNALNLVKSSDPPQVERESGHLIPSRINDNVCINSIIPLSPPTTQINISNNPFIPFSPPTIQHVPYTHKTNSLPIHDPNPNQQPTQP